MCYVDNSRSYLKNNHEYYFLGIENKPILTNIYQSAGYALAIRYRYKKKKKITHELPQVVNLTVFFLPIPKNAIQKLTADVSPKKILEKVCFLKNFLYNECHSESGNSSVGRA